MTINLQRADRKTEFWKIPDLPNIGPRFYEKENKLQFNNSRDA
jgi:hypothetical protein